MKRSPPMPLPVGSISPIVALAAIAASIALPPRSRIWTPARAASGWLAATMPNVVATTERPTTGPFGRVESRSSCATIPGPASVRTKAVATAACRTFIRTLRERILPARGRVGGKAGRAGGIAPPARPARPVTSGQHQQDHGDNAADWLERRQLKRQLRRPLIRIERRQRSQRLTTADGDADDPEPGQTGRHVGVRSDRVENHDVQAKEHEHGEEYPHPS